jgi:hypothetical protein
MTRDKELIWNEHPAPSSTLPEDTTYFTLGCGNPDCPHSISFEAGYPDANIIEEFIDGVSPRRITQQSIAYKDSNTVCPKDGAQCPNSEKLDRTVTILVGGGLLDNYIDRHE